MTSSAEPETSERYMQIARRWFTEGWRGVLAMADGMLKQIRYLPESVHAA
jgi:hypothetical protein